MYMSARIGARELRQNLSAVLKRVEDGERFVITSRNEPVAELAPLRGRVGTIQRMVDEGRATPAAGPMVFDPIKLEDGGMTLTQALMIERGHREED